MATVRVQNVGQGSFPVGGDMLYPGESRTVPYGIYESAKIYHPDELVILSGDAPAQPETASSEVVVQGEPVDSSGENEATVDPIGSPLPFAGQVFVLAGSFEAGREWWMDRIEAWGGTVETALTVETHYLVAGTNPGKKAEQARQMNVQVLTEQELGQLVEP